MPYKSDQHNNTQLVRVVRDGLPPPVFPDLVVDFSQMSFPDFVVDFS